MLQYWFRQERQITAPLRGLDPREEIVEFTQTGQSGLSIIPKTHGKALDTSSLHDEFVGEGLQLTHVSRIDRLFSPAASLTERFYYVLRFHYFPRNTAVVREDVDIEKLVICLNEINAMAFWGVRADLNRGRFGPWLSVSCKGRAQRYTGEDPDHPEMRNQYDKLGEKIGSAPVAPDAELHFVRDNRFEFRTPALAV